jgi:hypothetical protein
MRCQKCVYEYNGNKVRICNKCTAYKLLSDAYLEFLDKAEIICKDNGMDLKEVLEKQFKINLYI